ncbi:MAG TPA: histidinol-phosphate transaminase [Cyclobacteriaceae bacterium]|nr:histidinol-phosphate transaminase [Cyclobacteriaceae bacterium]
MENLSRRNWFKSTLAMSAGFALSSTMLTAAPMSKAEREFFARKSGNAKVRLNSNENPYGPSKKAREAIMQIMNETNRYQFETQEVLRKKIAEREGVDPSYIMFGAGSGEILCIMGAVYGLDGGSVLSSYPTFPLLMNYAQGVNARWDKVDLNDKLEHNYDAMLSAIKDDTKVAFICNPNNPTGTYVDAAKVRAFAEEASKKTLVYCDEAYLEFMGPLEKTSMVDLVRKGSNVIVARTFSKIYGLAGLRIGYIVAHPDIIRKLTKFGDSISASQTAIAAAQASLGDEDFMQLVRTRNAEARKVLTDYLDSRKYMHGKSEINVVFFPAPKDGKTILAKCEEKGYLIRIWDYQSKEWCRVSIGTTEEMKGFVKAFDEVIS